MEGVQVHAAARRGTRALLAKTIFRSVNVQSDLVSNVRVSIKSEDMKVLAHVAKCIVEFPVRVKYELSTPFSNDLSFTAFQYMAGLVYSFLVRTDGDTRRPAWGKHMPLIYHRSKQLISSDLGVVIAELSQLIEQKMKIDPNRCHEVLAELIVMLFQQSADCADDNVPGWMVSLVWIAEAIQSALTLMAVKLRVCLNDQFTTKVSPYRGIRMSRPEWIVLNIVEKDAIESRTGIPLSVPSSGTDNIVSARLEDFVTDLLMAEAGVAVFNHVKEIVFQVISNFNSRHKKASLGKDSPVLVQTLVRAWSDDADLRAISNVFKKLVEVARLRTADQPDKKDEINACLLANVLIGAWIGISEQESIASAAKAAVQLENRIALPESKFREERIDMSYEDVQFEFKQTLARVLPAQAELAITRIQAVWRGHLIRTNQHLTTICQLVRNSGWPDIPLMIDETVPTADPASVTLTRSSLMRLVPGRGSPSNQAERPITPASATTHKTLTDATSYVQPDLIQADHIACSKLYFILAYNIFMRMRMAEYYRVLIETFTKFTEGFGKMLQAQPQYIAVMNSCATDLMSRVAEAKKIEITAAKAAVVRKPKPVSLINKLAKEIRRELLSKQLSFREAENKREDTNIRKRTIR